MGIRNNKKILLLFFLSGFACSKINAQFSEKGPYWGFAFHSIYTYSATSYNSNLNIIPKTTFGGSITLNPRLDDRLLFNTGLSYYTHSFRTEPTVDDTYSSIGLQGVHTDDHYKFQYFQLPIGLTVSVFKKDSMFFTIGVMGAYDFAASGEKTTTYYDGRSDDHFEFPTDLHNGISFQLKAGFNMMFKNMILSMEPFYQVTDLSFEDDGLTNSSYDYTLKSIGISVQLLLHSKSRTL